jgi:hypothetical protein
MRDEGRKSRSSWVVGLTIPVIAMMFALFADLTLHGHGQGRRRHCHCRRAPAVVQPPTTPAPAPRAQSLDATLERLSYKCGAWENVDACGPRRFATTMATELPVFEANRAVLERRWLAELEGKGDRVAAYGLGWLRSERALPELRRRLIADRHWEFLEWGPPDDPADRFGDYQFPNHFAFAGAIEDITQRPWRDVVKLTGAERRRLRLDSRGCDGAFAAHWLLHELDGAPLPSRRANTAWRHRCEPNWPGG